MDHILLSFLLERSFLTRLRFVTLEFVAGVAVVVVGATVVAGDDDDDEIRLTGLLVAGSTEEDLLLFTGA